MLTGTRNVGDSAFSPVQAMKSYSGSRGLAPFKARR